MPFSPRRQRSRNRRSSPASQPLTFSSYRSGFCSRIFRRYADGMPSLSAIPWSHTSVGAYDASGGGHAVRAENWLGPVHHQPRTLGADRSGWARRHRPSGPAGRAAARRDPRSVACRAPGADGTADVAAVMGAVLPQREYGRPGGGGPPGGRAARRRPGPGPATGRPGRARCFPPRAPRPEQRRRSGQHRPPSQRPRLRSGTTSARGQERSLPARSERSERPVAGPARRRTLTSRETRTRRQSDTSSNRRSRIDRQKGSDPLIFHGSVAAAGRGRVRLL